MIWLKVKKWFYGFLAVTAGALAYARYQRSKADLAQAEAEEAVRKATIQVEQKKAAQQQIQQQLDAEKKADEYVDRKQSEVTNEVEDGERGRLSDRVNEW